MLLYYSGSLANRLSSNFVTEVSESVCFHLMKLLNFLMDFANFSNDFVNILPDL